MADYTIAAQVGGGQNAMAGGGGGGGMFNPNTLFQLMQMKQTMDLQRAAEQRALALHGPALTAAQQRVAAGGLELEKARREQADIKTADEAIDYMAKDPDWMKNYGALRKEKPKLWTTLDSFAQKKTAADQAANVSRVEYDKKRFDLNSDLAQTLAAVAPTVKDQASYERWLRPLVQNNPEIAASIPAEYSPENFGTAKTVVDRLRQFKVVRLPTGDDAVFDPVEKKFISTLTETGPQPFTGPQPTMPATAAPTAAPTGAPQRGAAAPLAGDAATMTANALRRFEGFREEPYWDVNAFRTGFGSDTITTPEGRVVKVQPGMRVTREDAERDLARRTTEFASTAARQAGGAWNSLPPNAQAALTSVAYNYGSLPPRILGAVQSGNPEAIARAVEGLAMDNNGVNYGRRMQEAAMIRGQAMPPAAGSPAVSASIGATERGMMAQPQASANALAPLFAAQMLQQQNAMAAPQQAPANIAPGLTAAATPAAGIGAPALTPAQQAKVTGVEAEAEAREKGTQKAKKEVETEAKEKTRAEFDTNLDAVLGAYKQLGAGGMLTTKETPFAERAKTAVLANLPVGATTAISPERGEPYGIIQNNRQIMLSALMGATGMTAKQIDSNAEMKNWLNALSSPDQTAGSILTTLNTLSKRFGSGRQFSEADLGITPQGRGKAGETPAAANIPAAAISRLKANPNEAAQFDAIFGTGAAAKVLGK